MDCVWLQISLTSVPKCTIDTKSALVQVMAWHHSHYLNQYWQWSTMRYGVTRSAPTMASQHRIFQTFPNRWAFSEYGGQFNQPPCHIYQNDPWYRQWYLSYSFAGYAPSLAHAILFCSYYVNTQTAWYLYGCVSSLERITWRINELGYHVTQAPTPIKSHFMEVVWVWV